MNGDQTPPVTPAPVSGGANQRELVISKLRGGTNILVAVSANPSIDQLTAAIALTMLLEKIKKNATAVFSGKIPTAMKFLKPAETFEKNTDSLRDFIISIDKSKADKLRYKVEDNVVKIFITPYKTSITEKDLQYNAGDFNVDVIVALGVAHQQDLDTAITAHGRIFHDAAVVSINNQPGGDFGVANWEEFGASSLSEVMTELASDLGPSLLDADIATALLTGIVAETSRFSNEKTHPQTMTISSKLLEAGADQQLVNSQLQDVIGSVVNLAAGTEIKPTSFHAEEAASEEPEELLIADDGSLSPKTDEQSADEAQPEADHSQEESAAEALLGTDIEPTPAPVLDEPEQSEAITVVDPNAAAEDAAFQADSTATMMQTVNDAVERETANDDTAPVSEPLLPFNSNLVKDASAPLDGSDLDDAVQAPSFNPASMPQNPLMSTAPPAPTVQPLAPNQPSYASPATTTYYQPPASPAQEPAPLGNSPADQAFTMPLPPASSFAPLVVPAPAGQNSYGPTPPPVPPALPPAGFGAQL